MKVRKTTSLIGFAALIVLSCLFGSCFKEDDPVQLQGPGNTKVFQVAMGEDYHRAVYFDFESTDTAGYEHDAWDLCFESMDSGWHVWMNGSNNAYIANADTQDFEAVTDTAGAEWKMDDPKWNIDSTAVGDWRINRMVYIIDRGPDEPADERLRKVIFQSVDANEYIIQFARLDGSDEVIYHVPKNASKAFVYFTFNGGGQMLDIEPVSNDWDIIFTRYRDLLYTVPPGVPLNVQLPIPYVVTGVLINPDIAVALDSTTSFDDINLSMVQQYSYMQQRDVIGYDWKTFIFATQAYVMKSNYIYILRDREGVYWKMHFIDFYNSTGQKGYPQYQYQRL